MRHLSFGEQQTWSEMQRDAAPEFTLIDERIRTARKQHKCCCCKHPIEPGQRYIHTVYLEDGKFRYDNRHNNHCWLNVEDGESDPCPQS